MKYLVELQDDSEPRKITEFCRILTALSVVKTYKQFQEENSEIKIIKSPYGCYINKWLEANIYKLWQEVSQTKKPLSVEMNGVTITITHK